jgi:hypothetical protein
MKLPQWNRVIRYGINNIMEIEDVIHAISDITSLDMFCSIAKESVESEVLKHKKGRVKNSIIDLVQRNILIFHG